MAVFGTAGRWQTEPPRGERHIAPQDATNQGCWMSGFGCPISQGGDGSAARRDAMRPRTSAAHDDVLPSAPFRE